MALSALNFFRVLFSKDKDLYKSIRNLFGFYPRNIQIYKLALSHKAGPQRYFQDHHINNERLEYLGDAVLSSIVADYLYKKYPFQNEGFLTEMRARIVSRSRFNKLALKMGFDKLIFNGEEFRTTSKSIFGDTFEAIIGAVYLDRGYHFTYKMVTRRIISLHMDVDEIVNSDTNYKSRILEYVQREKKPMEFRVVDEVGEGFSKQYIVELYIDNEVVAIGRDFNIKGAEKMAAEKACEKLLDEE